LRDREREKTQKMLFGVSVGLFHTQRQHKFLPSSFRLALFTTCICILRSPIATAALPIAAATTALKPPLMNDHPLPLEQLAAQATSYASANGVQVEKKHAETTKGTYFECAPMSLLPNAYPRSAFDQAQTLAPAFNLLVDRISRNGDFLQQTLGGGVADADPFTAKLLDLYQQIYLNKDSSNSNSKDNNDKVNFAALADRLGIHRSDYMLNEGRIQQVELNTIASSFGGLACQVAKLHGYLTARFQNQDSVRDFLQTNKRVVLQDETVVYSAQDGVPTNPTLDRLPAAMNVAHASYQSRFQPTKYPTIILFVVQEGESNTVDQRMLEFRLWEDYQIRVERVSLTKAHTAVTVDAKTGALLYNGNLEVAVVYYRAGYAPTDYPDGDNGIEWQARTTLECSRATKCPSLGYHLAGTKKVQQELARPGVLEKFFSCEETQEKQMVDNMRSAFAGLYSLGEDATPADLAAIKDAMTGGHARYVLKPQREGGGYNFYGEILAQKLKENVKQAATGELILDKKLGEFILMERLFPPQQTAVLLRSGKVEGTGDSISELGCFGTIVASPDGQVLHNEYAGFLLRTKFSNVDEGGVASGFATLSSPYLC
jgi:glutathione synthetase